MATFEDAAMFGPGTSQVGQVLATYEQLAAALGSPHRTDGLDRCTTEWCIRSRAGILTVYDRSAWADGDGRRPRGAIWWDIGGHDHAPRPVALHPVVALVHELTGCPVRDPRLSGQEVG